MEDKGGGNVLSAVLSESEWRDIPSQTAKKLRSFVEKQIEEFLTVKAVLETNRYNAESNLSEIKEQYVSLSNERDDLLEKHDAATKTITELENQVSLSVAEITKLQSTCSRLEAEMADFRHQRNLAIDERDELLKMIDRRNAEVERMQADIEILTKQLTAAVSAKCEALAQADEVASMKLTIEYKEKRLEQERALLNNQVQSLTQDLTQRTEELINLRRDNVSRCIQLETKLTEKNQELSVALEQIQCLTDVNSNLKQKAEELSEKLICQKEVHSKANESYMHELETKTKLAELYKSTSEEYQQHVEKLTKAIAELQDNLKTASEQYGDLETKYKEETLRNEEILEKKNECIAVLKKELETANHVIEGLKAETLQKDVEGISPTAATISRFLKSGMTMTEIYNKYIDAEEQLNSEREEVARLQSYIARIRDELEEKGPLIRQQRMDLELALNNLRILGERNDDLIKEVNDLKETVLDAKRSEAVTKNENKKLQESLSDLGRQVCHLLREVEHSRTGSNSSSGSTEQDNMSDSVNSADIISKRLVTFSDLHEMQTNNQHLLAVVRELTSRLEEAEDFDPAAVDNLKREVESLRKQQAESLSQLEKQNKMVTMMIHQRDFYKEMCGQGSKCGEISDVPMDLERNYLPDGSLSPKLQEGSDEQNEKIRELQNQIDKYTKELSQLKEESDSYRKEKTINEKMLIEQIDSMKGELKEMTRANAKLTSQNEMNEEKFKILNTNVEIYRNQIASLEKKNKIYNETIIKHEQTLSYLKDEVLQAETKLSRAEVMLGNLQKENALLRDAESRLLKEREMNKRESHTQNLIQTNIELIKATLERNDAESRIRLEARLDEAHRECAALRRRLQEEQDNFRQLSDHFKKQTDVVQKRMEEEKEQADKLRKELAEVREDLANKSMQIEDLTKKLKCSIPSAAEGGVDSRRLHQLEQMLSDSQAEVRTLQSKLKITAQTAEQHCNVAEAAEKQLKEIMELKQASDNKVKEQEKTIARLQEQCSELQGELSVQTADDDTPNSDVKRQVILLEQELRNTKEDLQDAKTELEKARNEIKTLTTNLEEVQNKYTHQVLLHSNDLQELTSAKEELVRALDEIETVKKERKQALEALEQNKSSWKNQEELFQREKEELSSRFTDMEAQNALLLDQIQALNAKITVIQAQATADPPSADTSLISNRSLTEDEVKSSDQLFQIIRYLRQEKDLAVSKCEVLEAEQQRVRAEHELLTMEYNEVKAALEAERQKSEVSVVTAAKHAEVLRKVETLNAITDSNRSLRHERDSLLSQVDELRTRLVTVEEQIAPLQEKNKELSKKAEAMQTENISIRAEATRWRQRANFLIEKSNRTSPEDWKKLQNERETLAKQLTIERSNNTKLTDENNNLKQHNSRLEEQLKSLRAQNQNQAEEINNLKQEVQSLQSQISSISQNLEQTQDKYNKLVEQNRLLTEETAGKDVTITDLKNNLTQIRKIAKKYKNQCEDQVKEIEALKQQQEGREETLTEERQEQLRQEGRSEVEQRIAELEQTHKKQLEELNQQVASTTEENDSFKKEIDNLKQSNSENAERFKTLFKNAKQKILTLTEQNHSLKEELISQESSVRAEGGSTSSQANDLTTEIERLEKEKTDILAEKQQEKDRLNAEIESLTQKVNQLQRQLGLQQGSKPSTSSASSDKSATEPPTANIKPMAGHSTNTQAQAVTVQPWRSGSEPPLASIRPMSMQVRTVAVLPTSQTPSAVMVPPQQQVHTTGSNTIEALSSSPTSSHTEYVPATSSASLAMLGPRQIAVPPTQSNQDTEDDDANMQIQPTPPQQAVALVLPRVEPPSSGPTQEQGTSSSSSNTVTTTQASLKRQREPDTDSCQAEDQSKTQQQPKRTRMQQGETETFQSVSESGLEVEYQVPTSSQRDHEEDTDAVIVVESDEDGDAPDEGDGEDDEPDDPDTEGFDMEALNYPEQEINYEDADCHDEEEEEAGNEVEVIEDSSEVPNQEQQPMQSTSSQIENAEQAQSEATSSGTDGSSGVTFSQASPSVSVTVSSFSRTRPVAPLSRQQQSHLLLSHLEEGGDDGIVPSTPTLFVPRRSDGFGEAVSSPLVPTSGRFIFNESVPPSNVGSNEIVPEQTLEIANVDDNSTGRSVPTTPLQSSPQEAGPSGEEQGSLQAQTDVELPIISVSQVADNAEQSADGNSTECTMGPPPVAGTSTEVTQQSDQSEDNMECGDGVTSEGEKTVTAEEGEEEGREAEASPSTNTRTRSQTGRGSGVARRSARGSHVSRGNASRSGPTPIVWHDPRYSRQDNMANRGGGMGRGSNAQLGSYSPRGARRSRGRRQNSRF